jgi:hypothetical protein
MRRERGVGSRHALDTHAEGEKESAVSCVVLRQKDWGIRMPFMCRYARRGRKRVPHFCICLDE